MNINDMDAPALRKLVKTIGHELSQAMEQIEVQQHANNALQAEIARLRIRREESSGDVAKRLVGVLYGERAEAAVKRTPSARWLTIDMNADFTIRGKRTAYIVSVREKDSLL